MKDLALLKGMPLDKLFIHQCPNVQDLTPLAGMSLTHITLPPQVTKGMDGLRKMKTLTNINGESPETFWKKWGDSKAK